MNRLWSAALGCMLIAGCAGTSRQEPGFAPCATTSHQEPKATPWAGLGEPTFPELLVGFGAANLAQDPDKTLARYFWSQPNSYARYMAVKKSSGDLAPLQQEATQQIQAGAAALACKRFTAETAIALLPYDVALGAFPVNPQPYDDFDRGQTIVNQDGAYGFRSAQIKVPHNRWMLRATQDQALQLRQALGPVGAQRFLHGMAVYTLDRCDQDPEQVEVLRCTGTMQKFYAYSSNPPLEPLYELVRDTR